MSKFTERHTSGRLIVRHQDDWCVMSADGLHVIKRCGTKDEAVAWCDARFAASAARHLHLVGAVGVIRTAEFEGVPHVVVPVVALVADQAVWPVNAPAPEMAPSDVLNVAPAGWNGRPCVNGHPEIAGRQVSANSPRILETHAFGSVFGAEFRDGRLRLEAWLNPDRAKTVGAEAERSLERLRAGDVVEVSVGCYVTTEERHGVDSHGNPYQAVWTSVVPDHLAILPEGQTGACSVESGCGAGRTARVHLVTASGMQVLSADSEPINVTINGKAIVAVALRGAPGSKERRMNKKPKADRIKALIEDPKTGYTLANQAELEALSDEELRAVEAVHGDPLPSRSLRERILSKFRFRGQEGQSDQDLRDALNAALRAVEPGYMGIDSVFPDDSKVVYICAPEDAWMLYRRGFTADATGTVTLADDREEVRPVTTYEPVAAAAAAASPPAPKSAGCGCGGTHHAPATAEENTMDRTQRVKALIDDPDAPWSAADEAFLTALPEPRFAQFEAAAKKGGDKGKNAPAPGENPATPPPTPQVPNPSPNPKPGEPLVPPGAVQSPVNASAAEPKTREQWLAEAPPEAREMFARHAKAEAERKAALIAALKGTQAETEYTAAELQALGVPELERIARLAKAPVPETDFSALGVPVSRGGGSTTHQEQLQNPPNGYRLAIEAGRKKDGATA